MASVLDLGLWETRRMYNSLIKRQPVQSFLIDKFFRQEDFSMSETVQFDIIKEGLQLAPFVSPLHQGKLMEKPAEETVVVTPAYMKPKMFSHAVEFMSRNPGMDPFTNAGFAARVAERNAMDLDTLRNYCRRREEWMAAQLLTTFQMRVKGDGVDYLVDLTPTTNHKMYIDNALLSSAWSGASDKTGDLEVAQGLIAADGSLTADIAVFGKTAWKHFVNDEDAMGALDNLNYSVGEIIRNGVKSGANFHGTYNGLELWTYFAYFKDPADGVVKPFIPDNVVVVGSTAARAVRHYAEIIDLDRPADFNEPIFPKVWKEPDPSGVNLMVQMRALPAIHDVDGFVSINVIDNAP